MSLPPVTLTRTPLASLTSTSSSGDSIASVRASTARSSPTASDSPSPIIATPAPCIIVLMSLKSRFTRPGLVMTSARPFIARTSTSSANRNAALRESRGTRSRSLSLGIDTTVSAVCLSFSRPHSAFSILSSPSPLKGSVTNATVKAPASLASFEITWLPPVPVPPPRPQVTKTMSEPCRNFLMSSSFSRAASSPICGRAPAPRPLVTLLPRSIFFGAGVARRC